MGGPSEFEGRVEIFHAGRWGTFCANQFDNREAQVSKQTPTTIHTLTKMLKCLSCTLVLRSPIQVYILHSMASMLAASDAEEVGHG